jgi:hypothetical protein
MIITAFLPSGLTCILTDSSDDELTKSQCVYNSFRRLLFISYIHLHAKNDGAFLAAENTGWHLYLLFFNLIFDSVLADEDKSDSQSGKFLLF